MENNKKTPETKKVDYDLIEQEVFDVFKSHQLTCREAFEIILSAKDKCTKRAYDSLIQ